jgi:hypothetical protein
MSTSYSPQTQDRCAVGLVASFDRFRRHRLIYPTVLEGLLDSAVRRVRARKLRCDRDALANAELWLREREHARLSHITMRRKQS